MDAIISPSASTSKTKRTRKLQHNWTSEETEQLIEAVQLREGTWNFLCADYRDRNLRESLWQDIAKYLKLPRPEVTTKWNSLRCSFRAAFNRMGASKSGQGANKVGAPYPLYNALKFLEPTLRVEASTTSNLVNIPSSEQSTDDDILDTEAPQCTPPPNKTPKKRPHRDDDSKYSKVIEFALQAMNASTRSDKWGDVGNFVASNGREFEMENPQLAKRFKSAITELVLNFQRENEM